MWLFSKKGAVLIFAFILIFSFLASTLIPFQTEGGPSYISSQSEEARSEEGVELDIRSPGEGEIFEENATLTINFTVRNNSTNEFEGDMYGFIRHEGDIIEVVEERNIDLGPDIRQNYTVDWTAPTSSEYVIEVIIPHHTRDSVEIEVREPPRFEIVESGWEEREERNLTFVDVSYVVVNNGGLSGASDDVLYLYVDGEREEIESLPLDPGNRTGGTFEVNVTERNIDDIELRTDNDEVYISIDDESPVDDDPIRQMMQYFLIFIAIFAAALFGYLALYNRIRKEKESTESSGEIMVSSNEDGEESGDVSLSDGIGEDVKDGAPEESAGRDDLVLEDSEKLLQPRFSDGNEDVSEDE